MFCVLFYQENMMKKFTIKLIPGDGIGVDVVQEAVRVLDALAERHGGLSFDYHKLDWSCQYYLKTGRMMPEDGMKILSDCDAILLGAVGFPGVPDHVSLRQLLLPIRVGFDQYVNLRPVKLLPGLSSPIKNEEIDFVVIRENSEGEYCGRGEVIAENTPKETVIQNSIFTRKGTERIIRYAFEYARRHELNKVLSATKSNALNYSMVFWDKVFDEIAGEYKTMESSQMHIDALSGYFIMHPDKLQVVVASNLFGDILTDLGSAMLGSIGISPSANLNPEGKFPSMFEPIHGSAPDIAGKGIANPLGTIWAVAMMLEHFNLAEESAMVMDAMIEVLSDGKIRTPDIGGTSTTTEVADAVIAALK